MEKGSADDRKKAVPEQVHETRGGTDANGAPPAKKPRGEASRDYVEEVVEDESQFVLVRFPCFDFFKHVALGEKAIPSADEGGAGARKPTNRRRTASAAPMPTSSSEDVSTSTATCCTSFAPAETIQFVPGTLTTNHPHLILNPGHGEREMRFRGVWEAADSSVANGSCPHTNRVVLKLTPTEGSVDGDGEEGDASAARDALPRLSSAVAGGDAVHSLLPHAREGLTADESRERREGQRRAVRWTYRDVVVPSAVLVMHRYM